MKISCILAFVLIAIYSSAQSGIIWNQEIEVATINYGNQHPRIVSDRAGNPLIIWGKILTGEVFFSRWQDTAFTPPVALNDSSMRIFTDKWAGPDIASFGDTVYVVVKEVPEDSNHVFLFRSFDGGLTFNPPVQVENLVDTFARLPSVTTDSLGNPIVAYIQMDPGAINPRYKVTRSYDFGNSFSNTSLASMYTGGNVCNCSPGKIVNSGRYGAFLFRDDFSNFRTIWCGISDDNCESFPTGIPVDQTGWNITSCPLSGPDAVIVGDSVYTVFMSGATGDAMCYISSASLSTVWPGPTKELTGAMAGLSNQNYPAISNNEGKVAVVCRQTMNGVGQLVLFFTSDIQNGLPQTYDTLVNGNISNGDVVLNDAVHVVWQDDNSETIKYSKGVFSTTSSQEIKDISNDLILYPNPATGSFSISLPGKLTHIQKIIIYDSTGRIVQSAYNENLSKVEIDLPAGFYLINAVDAKMNIHRSKIMVR